MVESARALLASGHITGADLRGCFPPTPSGREVAHVGAVLRQAGDDRPDPRFVDRRRRSSTYVTWLVEHGYSTRFVWHQGPDRVRLRRVRQARGAREVGELAGARRGVRRRTGRPAHDPHGFDAADGKEVRGPVEQMLDGRGRRFRSRPAGPSHARPFADVAPGFFDYLVEERGLRPASVLGYRHHLERFEAYLRRIGVASIRELSPAILSAFVVERAAPDWPGARSATVPACCGCSCATCTGKASSPPT